MKRFRKALNAAADISPEAIANSRWRTAGNACTIQSIGGHGLRGVQRATEQPQAVHIGQRRQVDLPANRVLRPEEIKGQIAQLDIDRLIEQLPIDAIISEVDIDALLQRVDIDGIVSRVDLESLMNRIDIGPIAVRVLDEVDIGSIVRESTGSVTGDMLNGGRVSAMRLDGAVAKVTDKLLLRRRARNHTVPQSGVLATLEEDALGPGPVEPGEAASDDAR